MAVAVGDTWSFAIEARLWNQQIINTFAMKTTAVPAATSEATYVDNWFANDTGYFNLAANLRKNILALQTADMRHLRILVARVTPNPTQVFIVTLVDDVLGTHAGLNTATNVAMSITRKGLTAGRRSKGRIAIAGLPQDSYQDGSILGALQITAAQVGVSMTGSKLRVAGDTVDMGFWSPAHTGRVNGQPIAYPAQFTPTVTYSVQSTLRVQRSRTVGVGS